MAQLFGEGTETRDHYKPSSVTASVPSSGQIGPPALTLGSSVTSSVIAFPWPTPAAPVEQPWTTASMEPTSVPASVHYRPQSAGYGSTPAQSFHAQPSMQKPLPCGSVRYLQGPYLVGSMRDGAGIERRPTSAQAHFTFTSRRQKEILQDGERNLWDRGASINAFVAARSRVRPQPRPGDAYLTSTKASFNTRPAADSQQHRLRAFNTAKMYIGHSPTLTPT